MPMNRDDWFHFEAHNSGCYEANWDGRPWVGKFEFGIITTGRSRVFHGVYVAIEGIDGRIWRGQANWCHVEATLNLFEAMMKDGLRLACAGLDPRFYTTGLSDGTGFGYLRGLENRGAFHVLQDPSVSQSGSHSELLPKRILSGPTEF